MTIRELQHLAEAMAHEVRNPLNSMAIHLELTEGRLKKMPESADRDAIVRSMGVVSQEIERIDRILEEYVQFSGPPDVARRMIQPKGLVDQVLGAVRSIAEEKGVDLHLSIGDTGPWCIDADAVAEAAQAVLANAIEASPKGSVIEVGTQTSEDQALLTISDVGEGIASEDLKRIFQIGFSRRGRSGVGLTVAKQIIKGHGGSLEVRSAGVGRGATFTLRIPLELA